MAEKIFLADINLNGHHLKNVIVDPVSEIPSTGVEGRIIYNKTDKKVYLYTDEQYIPIASMPDVKAYVDSKLSWEES